MARTFDKHLKKGGKGGLMAKMKREGEKTPVIVPAVSPAPRSDAPKGEPSSGTAAGVATPAPAAEPQAQTVGHPSTWPYGVYRVTVRAGVVTSKPLKGGEDDEDKKRSFLVPIVAFSLSLAGIVYLMLRDGWIAFMDGGAQTQILGMKMSEEMALSAGLCAVLAGITLILAWWLWRSFGFAKLLVLAAVVFGGTTYVQSYAHTRSRPEGLMSRDKHKGCAWSETARDLAHAGDKIRKAASDPKEAGKVLDDFFKGAFGGGKDGGNGDNKK